MQPNQFERLETLFGKNNVENLKNKKILIVGLGGVGGYVTECLARSGIGNITLVDYDTVDVTNLNRQIIALYSTIGKKKVGLFKKRINDINKNCIVNTYDLFISKDNYLDIFNNEYDFIIDCCDSMDAKKLLLKESVSRNINYISSMGTANKTNPTKLGIVELSKTINDPIAKIMRKFIKDEGIKKKVMVLSSTELPMKNGNKLGSNAIVPPIAGLLIGNYVINKLIDNNLQNN